MSSIAMFNVKKFDGAKILRVMACEDAVSINSTLLRGSCVRSISRNHDMRRTLNKLVGVKDGYQQEITHALTLMTKSLATKLYEEEESYSLSTWNSKDHLKKDYLKRNKKKSTSFVKKNAGQGSGMHSDVSDNVDMFDGGEDKAGLHELERRDVFGNKGLGKLEFCKNCVLGTSTRVSFGRGRVWVHFLRHKNEAFSKFKECKQLVENQIVRHLTVRRTHRKQNGQAEKMKRRSRNKVPIYSIGEEDTYGFMIKTSGELRDIEDIRLWRLDDVKPKIIISRDMMFNESLMYKDTLKGAGDANSGKDVEFEVELQGSINLENYVLVRDRAKRTIAIPARYRDEGVGIKSLLEVTTVKCHVTKKSSSECTFLLQLQPELAKVCDTCKQSQELKTVSYHKLYDILKQHQNEVNEIRAKRLARTANTLALVAQQQPVYHP
ncbi:hypothetical protein Tco_0414047 [Tanacetum coccineum]